MIEDDRRYMPWVYICQDKTCREPLIQFRKQPAKPPMCHGKPAKLIRKPR